MTQTQEHWDDTDDEGGFWSSVIQEWGSGLKKVGTAWLMVTLILSLGVLFANMVLQAQLGSIPNARFGGESRWLDLLIGPTWRLLYLAMGHWVPKNDKIRLRPCLSVFIWALSAGNALIAGVAYGMVVLYLLLSVWVVIELAIWGLPRLARTKIGTACGRFLGWRSAAIRMGGALLLTSVSLTLAGCGDSPKPRASGIGTAPILASPDTPLVYADQVEDHGSSDSR